MKKAIKSIKSALDKVCLVDKFLILFMIILFSYMAVHLFNGTTMQESNTVDVIIRTAASAIFGYFISSNFVKSDTKPDQTPEKTDACCNSVQIVIISVIGLICLILLFASRNFYKMTPEFSATVSQLRDFVSACIGFLVSCAKGSKQSN